MELRESSFFRNAMTPNPAPDFIGYQVSYGPITGSNNFSASGKLFTSIGVAVNKPNPVSAGVSFYAGYLDEPNSNADEFLTGYARGGGAAYSGIGGGKMVALPSKDGATIVSLGFGVQYSSNFRSAATLGLSKALERTSQTPFSWGR